MGEKEGDIVKDGVHKNGTSAEPGRDALEVATCPGCSGIVDLRSRRTGRNPDGKTWFFPHRRLRPGKLLERLFGPSGSPEGGLGLED